MTDSSFSQSASAQLPRMIKDPKEIAKRFAQGALFTAVDTETTGLRPEQERLLEIGAVQFDCTGVQRTFSVLINPGKQIPAVITSITGITDVLGHLDERPERCLVMNDLSILPDIGGSGNDIHQFPEKIVYTEDMCPRALQLLAGNVVLPISPVYTDEDAQDIVKGVKKVAASLL